VEAERALELDPHHAGAHHVMGRLHAGAMRLNRVARLALRDVLGASVLEGASWEEAERHFREAWRSDPTCPRHAMELGALYLDTDRPALARQVLAQAAHLAPREASDSLAVIRARTLLARAGPSQK
jgi:tetratricopeptide (TPR) repeat protein